MRLAFIPLSTLFTAPKRLIAPRQKNTKQAVPAAGPLSCLAQNSPRTMSFYRSETADSTTAKNHKTACGRSSFAFKQTAEVVFLCALH